MLVGENSNITNIPYQREIEVDCVEETWRMEKEVEAVVLTKREATTKALTCMRSEFS
jgi:hypothetical protein